MILWRSTLTITFFSYIGSSPKPLQTKAVADGSPRLQVDSLDQRQASPRREDAFLSFCNDKEIILQGDFNLPILNCETSIELYISLTDKLFNYVFIALG